MKINTWINKKIIYISTLLLMLVLMGIFLNSFYWTSHEIDKRKILVGFIVFFCVIIVPVLVTRIKALYNCAAKTMQHVTDKLENVRKNRKELLLLVGMIFVNIILAYGITVGLSKFILKTSYNDRLFYLLVALGSMVVLVKHMWKNAEKKPENVFIAIALILGAFCIGVMPCRVGVSWDDEIHYARTLDTSQILNGVMYEADEKNIRDYGQNIHERIGYDRETEETYVAQLEASYAAKEWNPHVFEKPGIWSVSYIPAAMGIILGRGLGLSYTGVFNMGRVFNLLGYALLIFLAIKRVKYGKVLVALIGLIPTTIFMASSYSYDWWVVGFTVLGFAYFFRELQDETPLENKNIVIMIGAIVLGCIPKAIYFPFLFPFLFMPKRKFKTSRQRKWYYASIIVGGLFLVATFLLPMIIGGAGTGDARGGADVNATEQIKFILNNPIEYTKILVRFDLDYISLNNASSMLYRFAYVGNGRYYGIMSLMLATVAVLDRGRNEKNFKGIKVASLFGNIVVLVLVTTALYISFNAVATEKIEGVQGRYLLPTIYPALWALGTGGTTHKINRNAFTCVPMLIVAGIFIYNISHFCVICY